MKPFAKYNTKHARTLGMGLFILATMHTPSVAQEETQQSQETRKSQELQELQNFAVEIPEIEAAYNQALNLEGNLFFSGNDFSKIRVGLDVKDASLKNILTQLAEAAKMEVAFDKDLPDEKYSFTFKNAPLDDALRLVTRTTGIGYSVKVSGEKKTLHFGKKRRGYSFTTSYAQPFPRIAAIPKAKVAASPHVRMPLATTLQNTYFGHTMPEKKIDVDFRNTNLRDALKTALGRAKVGYVLAGEIKDAKVTLSGKGMSLSDVLEEITDSTDISWHWVPQGDYGTVVVGTKLGNAFMVGQSYISLLSGDRTTGQVRQNGNSAFSFTYEGIESESEGEGKTDFLGGDYDFNFRDKPVREALQSVLDRAKPKIKYALEANIPDTKITIEANNASLRALLDAICQEGETRWQQEVKVNSQNGKQETQITIKVGGKAPSPYPQTMRILTQPGGVSRTITNLVTEKRHTFNCPHCKTKIAILGSERPDWQFCPKCGKPLPQEKRKAMFTEEIGRERREREDAEMLISPLQQLQRVLSAIREEIDEDN
jgi:Zn finger protein HypA/HybF involved in hydrogenase expression